MAGERTQPGEIRRHGSPGPAICENLVALDGFEDSVTHSRCRRFRRWRVLRKTALRLCPHSYIPAASFLKRPRINLCTREAVIPSLNSAWSDTGIGARTWSETLTN